MKKLLFLLLGVAVVASAGAGITKSPIEKKVSKMERTKSKVEVVTRANGVISPSTTLNFYGWDKMPKHMLRSDAAITWDFEDSTQWAAFSAVDVDDDGFNWQYFDNTGLTSNRMSTHSGEGVIASASYDKTSGKALTPDNWLISPEVTLGGVLSFWAEGQDASYCAEVFAVYVCIGDPVDDTSFQKVSQDFTATGEFVEYEIDLSAYQGQVGHFAIRHYNVTDMFWLNVDDITLDPEAVAIPYPVVPEINVTPATTSAYVEWAADEAADAYNLRWRQKSDGKAWSFPVDGYVAELDEGWWIYDADGDSVCWSLYYADDAQTDLCWGSGSYQGGGACSPDNYLGTPDVPLKGDLKFTLWGASDNYPEVLQVYAMVGEDMYQLFEDSLLSTVEPVEYTVNLDAFEGAEGCIIFRNYSTYDQWMLFIDDITIGTINPWNDVTGITAPNYTIEGLTPETTYEVQVMGYNEAHESDWCDIVEFTTLGEEPVIPDVYMLGGDDQGWAPNRGIKFDYNAEDNIYTLNYTFPAETNYFGFTTVLAEYDDQGSWDYIEPYRFGAVADGENFIFYDEYNGQPLDLTWDAYKSFQIGAGEYDIVVDLTSMKVILTKVNVEPTYIRGDVDKSGEVKIGDVTALINYLLNGDASLVDLNAADCDLSGDVKIGDVTALINYLLNGEW